MGSYRVCGCFTRSFRAAEAGPPADVRVVFDKYTGGGTHMTAEQLLRFLAEEQGEEGATAVDAERVVEEVVRQCHHITRFTRNSLTLEDFFYSLFSPHLNPPIFSKVYQDMTAPMSHYFIYTGHNSYLTGNQLSSDCSDVPIIQALQRGVRVIELDLWPTPNKDDVHVLHGRTLTSPVKLMKCLKSIKEHAFCTSPYPVILTLEDHLTPDLQAKVAQMVTEIFGEMLYYPESERMKEFPSPEELKYKIVISTKPPKEYLQVKSFSDEGSMSEKKNIDPFEGAPADAGPSPAAQDKYDKMEGDLETIEKQGEGDDDADELFDAKWQQSSVLAYKRLITIPAVPRGKLEESLKDDPNTVKRLSWSEQLLEKATTSYGPDVVRFTQKNILRIFPKITRFNSSNYNPFVGWMHGAQMVAFNMQGHGRSLWLMQGMFRANGGCGYIKKPDFLMNLCPDNQAFDPKSKLPVKTSLKVKIYMGDGWQKDFKPTHFDLYSPPDFYTKIGIAGVGEEETMKKTKIKEDEWVPVWEEEFKFGLRVPELAVLRVEVHEYDMSEKDDFAGQTCLPVSHLRSGFRAVPLFDRKGDPYPSVKLFMRFAFE